MIERGSEYRILFVISRLNRLQMEAVHEQIPPANQPPQTVSVLRSLVIPKVSPMFREINVVKHRNIVAANAIYYRREPVSLILPDIEKYEVCLLYTSPSPRDRQ